ncbi:DUF2071 domain-containing protein [Streptomyces canus]|uniref:DUF2071 domain-containing protein n=1 Tax=Streptomyces canus TaxID=58343 RepID=UPI003721F9DF
MVAYGAEQRVRVPAVRARRRRQAFVRGPFPPVIADARPAGVPATVPGLPTFAETNLRTYVRREDGRDGIWFLSIDVACSLMPAAGAVGAPYTLGALRVATDGDTVSYAGSRGAGRVSSRRNVRPGDPVQPPERDVWLTSRRRAYTRRLGRLWETPVEHEPWPPACAAVDVLEETLTAAAGLPAPLDEPVVHYSPGVEHVRLGPSRPLFT